MWITQLCIYLTLDSRITIHNRLTFTRLTLNPFCISTNLTLAPLTPSIPQQPNHQAPSLPNPSNLVLTQTHTNLAYEFPPRTNSQTRPKTFTHQNTRTITPYNPITLWRPSLNPDRCPYNYPSQPWIQMIAICVAIIWTLNLPVYNTNRASQYKG